MGGSERPKGRKVTKRRLKEKANNTVVDLVTTKTKSLISANTNMSEVFKDFIHKSNEDKFHKMIIREQK